MHMDFMLIAHAGLKKPLLRIAVIAADTEGAKFECKAYLVGALSKAGYSQFTLYDTRRLNANGADIQIARFGVESQEPIVFTL